MEIQVIQNKNRTRIAVKTERNFTCFFPKYSLIMSVIIKTIGQVIEPADILKDKSFTPKSSRETGSHPKVFSTEKIFTPMNSDIIVLATKNADKTNNKRLSFELKVIEYENKIISRFNFKENI